MKIHPAWILSVLLLLVSAVLSHQLQNAKIDHANDKLEWSDKMLKAEESYSSRLNDTLKKYYDLTDRVSKLDEVYTKRLNDAQLKNDELRRLYSDADDERRRLRIDVIVARNDAKVSTTIQESSSSGVGDAASLELTREAGQAVWDIRGGMIEDREKILYLQDWIRELQKE